MLTDAQLRSPEDQLALLTRYVRVERGSLLIVATPDEEVERAPDEFRFLHLSFQEYLAARFLSERRDVFARLKPHLHDPRWGEVILLTADCLREEDRLILLALAGLAGAAESPKQEPASPAVSPRQ